MRMAQSRLSAFTTLAMRRSTPLLPRSHEAVQQRRPAPSQDANEPNGAAILDRYMSGKI